MRMTNTTVCWLIRTSQVFFIINKKRLDRNCGNQANLEPGEYFWWNVVLLRRGSWIWSAICPGLAGHLRAVLRRERSTGNRSAVWRSWRSARRLSVCSGRSSGSCAVLRSAGRTIGRATVRAWSTARRAVLRRVVRGRSARCSIWRLRRPIWLLSVGLLLRILSGFWLLSIRIRATLQNRSNFSNYIF